MKNISYMLMGAGIALFLYGLFSFPNDIVVGGEWVTPSIETVKSLNRSGGIFVVACIALGLAWFAMFIEQVEP